MAKEQTAQSVDVLTNVELVRRYYGANTAGSGGGDADAEAGMLDPQVDWRLGKGYSMTGTYIGPKAVMEGIVPALLDAFDDFSNTPEEFFDAGDTVICTGRYKGRGKITGEEMDAEFVHLWTMRDGKVVRLRQYTDTAEFNRVLGEEGSRRMDEHLRPFRSGEEA